MGKKGFRPRANNKRQPQHQQVSQRSHALSRWRRGLAFEYLEPRTLLATLQHSLFPSDGPPPGAETGYSVAADTSYHVVGSPYSDVGGINDTGLVRVFNATTGALVTTIVNPERTENDHFGYSVAISGSTIVVGTPQDDATGIDSGRAYLFNATTGALMATLSNPAASPVDQFGHSVAISGGTVIVGARYADYGPGASGRAYVFDATTGAYVRPLNNPAPDAADEFGASVAVSGTTVVVGAPLEDAMGNNSGRAYVFNVTTGALVTSLNNPAGAPDSYFGQDVAISGNTIVVGAYSNPISHSGTAYVFNATTGTHMSTLVNPMPTAFDYFGWSVAVSGSTAIVGSQQNIGRAYIFDSTDGTLVATLANPTPSSGDSFGNSVAVSGNTVIVGAPFDDTGATNSGRAYVFDATTGSLTRTLDNPPPPASLEYFGSAVSISDNRILVGAYKADGSVNNTGQAYLFDATTGEIVKVLPNPVASDDWFGYAVAVSGDIAVVGALASNVGGTDSGRIYLFNLNTGAVIPVDNPSPNAADQFGISVAISGDKIVVGAYRDSSDGLDSGRAYVFNTSGALVATLFNPTPGAGDRFGTSVAISGNIAVVGSVWDDTTGTNSGQVHLFNATTGARIKTIENRTPAPSDEFGYAVAISGNTVVVGATGDDAGFTNSGQAYIYDTSGNYITTLVNPTPSESDQFGFSVATDGVSVVVGDVYDDAGGTNSGQAHVFDAATGALRATIANPTPVVSDTFGNTVAVSGNTVVVGALGDETEGSDQGAAYVFALGVPPAVTLDNPTVTQNEGTVITNGGAYSDPDATDDVLFSVVSGPGVVNKTGTNSGTWTWSYTPPDGPAGPVDVVIRADDGHGGVVDTPFTFTVDNVSPEVTSLSAGVGQIGPGETVRGIVVGFDGAFVDPGADAWHGEATISREGAADVVVPFTVNADKTFQFGYAFSDLGLHTITARVFDDQAGVPISAMTTMNVVPFVVNDAGDINDLDILNGITTLREAIDLTSLISGPDFITFAPGMSGQTIAMVSNEFYISETLTIDATALAENVIIDAQQQSRVMNFSALTGDLTLSGLTMRNGRTTANSDPGGGIRFNSNGNLTLNESTLTGNSTTANSAAGGGIQARDGIVTLNQSTVSGNSTAGVFSHGGGIYIGFGAVTLNQSTVSGNSAGGNYARGGGIYAYSGAVVLNQSTLAGNSTSGYDASGGGINARNGAVTITQSTLWGNSTSGTVSHGGGVNARSGAVALNQSTVSENSTSGLGARGGGIRALYGDVTLNQSTLSGNYTSGPNAVGGGIYAYATVTLDHSTITQNSTSGADAHGGGIFVVNSAVNPPLTIRNSIVAGNLVAAGSSGPDLVPDPQSTISVDYGVIGTGIIPTAGSNNVVTDDPMLGPLADNGGLTQTHALLPGSPALNAGDPTIVFNPAEFDQRGAPFFRVLGDRIDIGSYEAEPEAPSFVVTTASDVVDAFDYETSLREAIEHANATLGADVITFETGMSGQTILMTGGEFVIIETLTIDATALAENVIIDAQQQSRVMRSGGGDLTLAGLTMRNGRTTGSGMSGGGIRFESAGNLTISESIVSGNITVGDFAGGGGIYMFSGTVTLNQSIVSGNSASSHGGGIMTQSGTVILNRSTVSGNSTSGGISHGGGVFTLSGAVTLNQSTLSGNSTAGGGSRGGGIFTNSGAVTLNQSTVSGNSTLGELARGGGIYTYAGAVTLDQSTLFGNSTAETNADGGGIFFANSSDNPTLTVLNSILAGNSVATGSTGPDLVVDPDSTTIIEYSLIGTDITPGAGGGININNVVFADDPLLGPLADNGGPTQTHALLPRSPAINAGDPTIVFNPAEFDQRGAPFVRVFGGRIDIGAFESEVLMVNNIGDTDDGDISNGVTTLREAINFANVNSGADVITFNTGLSGETILLGGTELEITESLTIDATALDENVAIDAQQLSRVMNFSASSGDLTLTRLTMRNGGTTGSGGFYSGGGIRFLSSGDLTLSESTLTGNSTVGEFAYGGGIFTDFGAVTLNQSTISGNSTAGNRARGGGIFTSTGVVTLNQSSVWGNSTAGDYGLGGGIHTSSGAVTLNVSTLTGNNTVGEFAYGGGVYTRSGAVTLNQSTLSGNYTSGFHARGGGIFSFYGAVTLYESTVSGNSTASGDGGGIFAFSGTVTLNQSAVSDNSTLGDDSNAGGIFTASGDVILNHSTLSGNRTVGSSAYGGGIFTISGDATLYQSTLSENSTAGTGASGGGIHTVSGTVTLNQSTLSGNSTSGNNADGGGIYAASNTVALNQSTLSGNNTSGPNASGGGIATTSGAIMLGQSTLSGNSTFGNDADGGGIWTFSGAISLSQSTVTRNSAAGIGSDGGGIYSSNSIYNRLLTIGNSIVAGNTVATGSMGPDLVPDPDSTITVDYSLIGTGIAPTAGGNNISTDDPLLGPLADNGGPTQTHALLPGSPAIDAGDPAIVFNPADFDQRGMGFVRVVDGNSDSIVRMDIGAYEAQFRPSADFDTDGDVDGRDFLAWQRGYSLVATATRADGDSDADMDVDGSDLAAWEVSYGISPVPESALTVEPTASESPALDSATLIDAALALALAGNEADEVAALIASEVSVTDEVFASTGEPTWITPALRDLSEIDWHFEEGSESETDSEPWLADELLECVFG